ncbi:uncharacterized protein [Drosophila bipectinata]|uniref:uncharacterized protein n=1 Tax=Drosophila bipectinata TaxID=42026 RepID=UPI0038B3B8FC
MGKDPSAVVLATALAFCAFCPFFARCDETELNIKKGIENLSKILVKYQAEFDRKVKFAQLQEAVDEIDKAMLGYKGKAKVKLPLIRSLNSEARLTYQNCVDPVFEWCISVNRTFDIFIDKIGDSKLSETNMVAVTLESGLEKTGNSLELLTNVQHRTAQLKNAFEEMFNDVHYDFSPGGFYGKEKAELQKGIKGIRASLDRHLPSIFTFGIEIGYLKQKITYMMHLWDELALIEHFFTVLTQKIENATDIVKDMESNLEEDKTNLHKLRKHIASADFKKDILLCDTAFLRLLFIPDMKHLKDSCAEYVNWHGFDAPIYQKINSRIRFAASTFYESEPSPA